MTRTPEELMKLLAKLTGWEDQSLGVEVGYKRARNWRAQDESYLDDHDWGWVASTTICGLKETKLSGQGKTLEGALLNLARQIPDHLEKSKSHYEDKSIAAHLALRDYINKSPL